MKKSFLGLAVFVMMAVFVMPMAAFAAGGTLYIDGDLVVGIPLAADQSGTGWDWDSTTDTLTLGSTYGGEAVYFNTGDTIYVTYSGNVAISATGFQALVCDYELIITGDGGKLTLKSSGGVFHALFADRMTIGGNADIYAESDGSTVVSANVGDLIIKDNASVTVKGIGADTRGIYADTGSITINTTGTVDVTATGTGYALEASSDIDIMNGTVDLTADDDTLAYDPTPTFTGGVVTVNGTVVYGVPTLTFTGSAAYSIPPSTVGTPIANINVSGGVSGGTPPYEFTATGLPAGIAISTAGVISGTPTAAGAAGTATVTVTDSAAVQDSKSITINFGAVSAAGGGGGGGGGGGCDAGVGALGLVLFLAMRKRRA